MSGMEKIHVKRENHSKCCHDEAFTNERRDEAATPECDDHVEFLGKQEPTSKFRYSGGQIFRER